MALFEYCVLEWSGSGPVALLPDGDREFVAEASGNRGFVGALNELAEDGWELISASGDGESPVLWLRRPAGMAKPRRN